MQKIQKSLFSQNPELWNPKEKIWKHFSQAHYEDDIIEFKLNCHSLKLGILKPICLEVGKQTLYYSKKSNHSGQLSLRFTTMILKNFEGRIIISLQKNSNVLDLITDEFDFFKSLLMKRCILTSFQEDFILEKQIGNGNKKANVFQALRTSTNQRVAVKAYSKEYLNQFSEEIKSLKNEIKAMRMFNSQHIIQLKEVHETDNSIYLIMDLIEGGLLKEKMINKVIPEQTLSIFLYNFIKALYQIHSKNVILKNMASDNILFQKEDSLAEFVIVDFSQAQFIGKISQRPQLASEFVAPELLENKIIDDKCDIYSAGVIVYKLIVSGEVFYPTNKPEQKFLDEKFTQIPKALQSLIKKMLRIDPKKRYTAEKCLQHRYFKKIFNSNDIFLNNLKSPQRTILQRDKYSPSSAKLPDSDNFESGSSLNSISSKSAQEISLRNIDDEPKNQIKQSKFSKFCSQMQEHYQPQINKKPIEESLFKLAVANSYFKQEQKGEVQYKKSIGARIGFLKKSNSLNI